METGFKKLFSRTRDRIKPAEKVKTAPDIRRDTTAHHGFTFRPSSAKGVVPNRANPEKVKQKSFSHLRRKSNAIQEFAPSAQAEVTARPSTAPANNKPSSIRSSSLRSKFHYRPRGSQEEKRMRSTFIDRAPNIPALPRDLADMGSKSYDLIQAAACHFDSDGLANSSHHSVDLYNERVANRNSSKAISIIPPSVDTKSSVLEEENNHRSSKPSLDAQRASFEGMRACRTARVSTERAAAERNGAERPSSSIIGKEQALGQVASRKRPERQSRESDSSSRISSPALLPRTEGDRSSGGGINVNKPSSVAWERSPALQVMSTSRPALVNGSPSSVAQKRLPPRANTSKALPSPKSLNDISQKARWIGGEESDTSTAATPEDGKSDHMSSAAAGMHIGLPIHGDSTCADRGLRSAGHVQSGESTNQIHGPQAPQTISDAIGSGMEENEEMMRKKKRKQDHHQPRPPSARCAAREEPGIENPSSTQRTGANRRVDAHPNYIGSQSAGETESGSDAEMVDAVTHQAESVHIVSASVVSANCYTYRDGQKTVTRNWRPQSSQNGIVATARGAKSHVRGEERTALPNSAITTSSLSDTSSIDLAARPRSSRIAREEISGHVATPSPLKLPARDRAAPKTVSPQFKRSHRSYSIDESPAPSLHSDDTSSIEPESVAFVPPPGATPSPPEGTTGFPERQEQQQRPSLAAAAKTSGPDPRGNGAGLPSSAPVVTRDFALSSSIPTAHAPTARPRKRSEVSSKTNEGVESRGSRSSGAGSDIQKQTHKFEDEDSELERRIAAKKQAAAKALLRLQEVMIKPTWEEGSSKDYARTARRVPGHWRDLSIEDGSPIAPSAIFSQVKIPALGPPISRHSTFAGTDGQSRSVETTDRGAERRTARNPASVLDISSRHSSVRRPSIRSSEAPLPPAPGSPQRDWKGRSTATATMARTKQAHSRHSSMVSADSGSSSAHSVPHYMVPVRSSSTRDSDSVANDSSGDVPRFHVGRHGWR